MPGKRSDPKKLARDREEIMNSLESFARVERVKRSRDKAVRSDIVYRQTGEGTMGEAFQHLLKERAERKHYDQYGGPPVVKGGKVTGRSHRRNPV